MPGFRFGWAYSKEDEKAILKTKIAMMEAKLRTLQDLAKEEPEIASVLKAKEAALKENIDLFKKELAALK
jgi:capsule polysaccharide export protein KpsE/RkpR